MNTTAEQRYQANPHLILRQIAGEAVLVPVGDCGPLTNSIISLNETGAYLFKLFAEPATVEEVIEKAKAAYQDPDGRMAQEIEAFVQKYVEAGLLASV